MRIAEINSSFGEGNAWMDFVSKKNPGSINFSKNRYSKYICLSLI